MSALPAETRAALIAAVLAERYPKLALGAIASRFSITLAQLQAVLQQAGYPDTARMAAAQAALEAEAARRLEDPTPAPSGSDDAEGRLLVVPVDALVPDPDNPRPLPKVSDPDVAELAESIAQAGLLQPIIARRVPTAAGHELRVVMGHRRLAAVRRLERRHIECIIRGPMSPDEVLAAMLIENGQRRDLDPISEARGLRRLQQLLSDDSHQCTDTELARRIGRSAPFVADRILLLQLDAETQDRIRAGELAIGAAVAAARRALGRTGTKGVDRNWHLGPTHDLAGQVRRACETAEHPRGRRLGGIGCGECWETVIRANERARLVDHAHASGRCPTCGAGVSQQPSELAPVFSGGVA